MLLFDLLDKYMQHELFHYVNHQDWKALATAMHDTDHLYSIKLLNREHIPIELLYDVPHQKYYDKLFTACPYLKDMPQDEDMIVAGGFINIALDKQLKYKDYPTSDIDIFICQTRMKYVLKQLLKYFDSLHATYKMFVRDIVNVFIPGYPRNFQIIFSEYESVSDIISYFHTSNVKCGLHKGVLKTTPDCYYAIKSGRTAIESTMINAYTLKKILHRGYEPMNCANYKERDFNDSYESIVQHAYTGNQSSKEISSREVMNRKIHKFFGNKNYVYANHKRDIVFCAITGDSHFLNKSSNMVKVDLRDFKNWSAKEKSKFKYGKPTLGGFIMYSELGFYDALVEFKYRYSFSVNFEKEGDSIFCSDKKIESIKNNLHDIANMITCLDVTDKKFDWINYSDNINSGEINITNSTEENLHIFEAKLLISINSKGTLDVTWKWTATKKV